VFTDAPQEVSGQLHVLRSFTLQAGNVEGKTPTSLPNLNLEHAIRSSIKHHAMKYGGAKIRLHAFLGLSVD
jgi:hypothetical protein